MNIIEEGGWEEIHQWYD